MSNKLFSRETFFGIAKHASMLKSISDNLYQYLERHHEIEAYAFQAGSEMGGIERRSVESQLARVEADIMTALRLLKPVASQLEEFGDIHINEKGQFVVDGKPVLFDTEHRQGLILHSDTPIQIGQMRDNALARTSEHLRGVDWRLIAEHAQEIKRHWSSSDVEEFTVELPTWVCDNHPPGSEVEVEKGKKCSVCGRSEDDLHTTIHF